MKKNKDKQIYDLLVMSLCAVMAALFFWTTLEWEINQLEKTQWNKKLK